MPTDTINLIGAGGHAAVVLDTLLATGHVMTRIHVWTHDIVALDQQLLGVSVRQIMRIEDLAETDFHICIGDNGTRKRLCEQLCGLLARPVTIVHPHATLSSHATVGLGSFVAAQAVVAPRAHVGMGTIINHGAVIDHDCSVGSFVHVAPGATLGGGVTLEDQVLVGAGSNILPARHLGRGCTIGAGSVVVHDTEDNGTYVGVPATLFRQRNT